MTVNIKVAVLRNVTPCSQTDAKFSEESAATIFRVEQEVTRIRSVILE
jgi:hypothetical protein